jgi:hypothetical protein
MHIRILSPPSFSGTTHHNTVSSETSKFVEFYLCLGMNILSEFGLNRYPNQFALTNSQNIENLRGVFFSWLFWIRFLNDNKVFVVFKKKKSNHRCSESFIVVVIVQNPKQKSETKCRIDKQAFYYVLHPVIGHIENFIHT